MLLKKILSFKNGLLIYSLVLILINILLTQFPLTSTFGYEFAAFNGLILTILSALYTFNLLKKSEFSLAELIKNLLVFFLLPFIITVINSMLTRFCSFVDGLIFYLLIVSVSILFGTALAFLISLITKKYCRLLFFLTILLIALIPILEIYFNPQVYFYSPLIGFFPGNIYDEGLSADLKLFFHQLIVTLFSITSIYIVLIHRQLIAKKKYYFIFAIILLVIGFQFSSPALGFNTTFSKLKNALPKVIESGNFSLHYDKMNESEAAYVALNAEYYYLDLIRNLNVKPPKQIQIYLFNDRLQKKILFGAGNADVAKPWQYAVYINVDSWERTLKHELVHIFSAEFGTGIFKLAAGFNPSLIEGLAAAIEGTSDDISIMDFTRLAFNYEHKLDINYLLSGFNFFKSNSALGYTYSGAFIQFLIEKYGIDKVKDFYANGDFSLAFNSGLNLEQKQFETKLKESSFGNQAMADYYFGRLSILQKVCPRFISDRLIIAFEYLESKKYQEAEKLFNEINNKTLNYSAIIGLSEVYLKKNMNIYAIKLVKNSINKFANTPYYYNLIFRLGDLYVIIKQNDSSAHWYNKIISSNPNYHFNYLIGTRLDLLKRNKLFNFLDETDSVKLKLLIELNDSSYNYNSIPIILDLLESQKVNYDKSISIFNKTFIVDNLESSYAAFKLSQYMLANGDYINGRKYAAISLRFKIKNPFYKAMNENFDKAKWLYSNGSNVLESFKIGNVKKND